jgi:preprotein translocase subunit SecD
VIGRLARASGLVALALLVACGVGTYRSGRVTGELEMRLVASEGRPGEPLRRWFTDETLRVEDEPFVQTEHVREVQLENLPDGGRQLVLYLNEVGAQRLAEVTQAHEGRRLAIVVDRRILAAPVIRGAITDGVAALSVPDEHVEEVFGALTTAR